MLREHASVSFERVSYVLAAFGVFGDQLSTKIGLLNSNIVESNLVARFLMSFNVWFLFDFIILSVMIGSSYIFLRKSEVQNSYFILVFPFLIIFLLDYSH